MLNNVFKMTSHGRNKQKKSRARKIAKKGENGQKHAIFQIEIAL